MDQDRPIEKLLGRAAKRRREQAAAPFEIHPATRKLLQGEVARAFPKGRAEGTSRGFLGFLSLHRFALGAGAFAILVGAGLLILAPNRSQHPQTFAQNDQREQEILKQPNAAPLPIAQPADEQRSDRAKSDSAQNLAAAGNRQDALNYEMKDVPSQAKVSSAKEEQLADKVQKPAKTAAAPAIVSNDSSATAGGAVGGFGGGATVPNSQPASTSLAQNEVLMRSRAFPLPAPAPAPATAPAAAPIGSLVTAQQAPLGASIPDRDAGSTDAMTFADARREVSRSLILQQPQSTRFLNKAKIGTTELFNTNGILASFSLEQEGDTFRVVDYDGSVYIGSLFPAQTRYGLSGTAQATARPAPAPRFKNQPAAASPDAATAAPSLPAASAPATPIPTTFNFRVAGTNRTLRQPIVFTGTITPGLTNLVNNGSAPASSTMQPYGWFGNSTVVGRAVINSTQQLEIQASPTNSTSKSQ